MKQTLGQNFLKFLKELKEKAKIHTFSILLVKLLVICQTCGKKWRILNKRDLTSPFYFARTFSGKCLGVCLSGRRCQIFSHYIIPHFFCQVKKFFKFFSANFSLHRQVCVRVVRASNFMRCQILINQLRSSYIS